MFEFLTKKSIFKNIKDVFQTLGSDIEKNSKIVKYNQELIHNAEIPVFIFDSRGRLIYANTAYKNLLEADLSDILDFGWQNFIHPEMIDAVKIRWYNLIVLKEEYRDKKTKYVNSSGKIIEVTSSVVQINENGYIGWLESNIS